MRFRLLVGHGTNVGGDCYVWGGCGCHKRSFYVFTNSFCKSWGKFSGLGTMLEVLLSVVVVVVMCAVCVITEVGMCY